MTDMSEDWPRLARAIRAVMQTRGIYSSAELSRRTGVSDKTLSQRLFRGMPVADRTVQAVEQALGVPFDWSRDVLAGRTPEVPGIDNKRLIDKMRAEDAEMADRAAQSDPRRDAG
jgi:lambda repressor-like predicted transcriptional regulator